MHKYGTHPRYTVTTYACQVHKITHLFYTCREALADDCMSHDTTAVHVPELTQCLKCYRKEEQSGSCFLMKGYQP